MLRRKTTQEAIVFDAIEYLGHPTSEELITYIRKNDSDISLATIYRNVNKLFVDGRIKKMKIGSVEVVETIKAKHYHYICRCCGSIIDVAPRELPINLGQLNSVQGEDISDCDLVLYGVCHTCKEKGKGEQKNEEVCM